MSGPAFRNMKSAVMFRINTAAAGHTCNLEWDGIAEIVFLEIYYLARRSNPMNFDAQHFTLM